jgi:hypothetical protein
MSGTVQMADRAKGAVFVEVPREERAAQGLLSLLW